MKNATDIIWLQLTIPHGDAVCGLYRRDPICETILSLRSGKMETAFHAEHHPNVERERIFG